MLPVEQSPYKTYLMFEITMALVIIETILYLSLRVISKCEKKIKVGREYSNNSGRNIHTHTYLRSYKRTGQIILYDNLLNNHLVIIQPTVICNLRSLCFQGS